MHNIGYIEKPENVNRSWVLDLICDEACREGDGYSGPLKWHDEIQPLENRAAAEEKLKQLDKGWYDDHAVRFYDYSDAKPTKRIDELQKRIAETRDKMRVYAKEHSVLTFKAEFIGCTGCGAKLPRKLLHSDYCPVCRHDMRSDTTLKKLEEYGKKIEQLADQIAEEKKKQPKAKKVMWLIKYEYHS